VYVRRAGTCVCVCDFVRCVRRAETQDADVRHGHCPRRDAIPRAYAQYRRTVFSLSTIILKQQRNVLKEIEEIEEKKKKKKREKK